MSSWCGRGSLSSYDSLQLCHSLQPVSCGVSAKELCQDLQRLAARGSLRGAEKRLASQHGTAGDLYTREWGKFWNGMHIRLMMLSLLFEGGADGMEAFVASILWKMISWLAKQNRYDGVISHVPLWPIFPWYSWTDCSDTLRCNFSIDVWTSDTVPVPQVLKLITLNQETVPLTYLRSFIL